MNDTHILIYVLGSMGLFLLIAVGIIIFINRSQLKVNKIKLHEQKLEINFQTELLQNTVKTQEDERRRIAAELHDDIASKLNIIHLNVHLLKKGGDLSMQHLNIIDKIETSLNVSIERSRSIAHELLPQVFKKFGIHQALKELEQSINLTQTILVSIESAYLIRIADELKLLHILRIIQELVQNTIKYAEAKYIYVTFIESEENTILMTYKDDGKGFNIKETPIGLGISNIKTRAKLLNGTAEFSSIPVIKGMMFTLKFNNYD